MPTSEHRIATVQGYSVYQIGLHWLIAVLVLAQLVFGESMTEAIEAAEEGKQISGLESSLAGMHFFRRIDLHAATQPPLFADCKQCLQARA
jgi:hypothetical protein